MVIICFKAFVQNDFVLSYFVYCLMFGPFQSNRRLQIKNNIIYSYILLKIILRKYRGIGITLYRMLFVAPRSENI